MGILCTNAGRVICGAKTWLHRVECFRPCCRWSPTQSLTGFGTWLHLLSIRQRKILSFNINGALPLSGLDYRASQGTRLTQIILFIQEAFHLNRDLQISMASKVLKLGFPDIVDLIKAFCFDDSLRDSPKNRRILTIEDHFPMVQAELLDLDRT